MPLDISERVAISNEIVKKYDFQTSMYTDHIHVYMEKTGVWTIDYKFVETQIKRIIGKRKSQFVTRVDISEIMDCIRRLTYVPTLSFENPEMKIALKNKTFNFETFKTEPHNKDNNLTFALDVEYDPKAKCPKFEKFLKEVVNKKQINSIHEFFGYCLYPNNFIDTAFMLVGSGANGKSVLLDVLTALIGTKNVVSEELQDLVEKRFSIARLNGKMANISADISSKTFSSTGTIKKIISGDRVSGEHKHAHPFDFRPRCKLISSCNQVPASKDQTFGWYRRWFIIEFPNSFKNNQRKRDLLLNSMTTPTELSGILNLALKGMKRLRKRGRFEDEIDEFKKEMNYLRYSDPLKYFLGSLCVFQVDKWIKRSDLFDAYVKFCRENNRQPKTVNIINREIEQDYRVEGRTKTIGLKQQKIWRGIDLRPKPIKLSQWEQEQKAIKKQQEKTMKKWGLLEDK